jgi:hypothetical protein
VCGYGLSSYEVRLLLDDERTDCEGDEDSTCGNHCGERVEDDSYEDGGNDHDENEGDEDCGELRHGVSPLAW